MLKDLVRIADFLDKSGRTKDADLIDYISQKYADGDLKEFFRKGMQKDFIQSEFGKRNLKKASYIDERIPADEIEETERLLDSLHESLIRE